MADKTITQIFGDNPINGGTLTTATVFEIEGDFGTGLQTGATTLGDLVSFLINTGFLLFNANGSSLTGITTGQIAGAAPATDGTYTPVTSITIVQGIITAIS